MGNGTSSKGTSSNVSRQGHCGQRGKGGTAARAAVATDGLVCGRRRGSLHVPDYLTGSEREGGSHNYS